MSASLDKDASIVLRDDSSSSDKPGLDSVVKLGAEPAEPAAESPAEKSAEINTNEVKPEIEESEADTNTEKSLALPIKSTGELPVPPEALGDPLQEVPYMTPFKPGNDMYCWYAPMPQGMPDASVAYPCVPLAAYAPVATEDEHAANMKAIAATLAGLKNARDNESVVPHTVIPASLAASKDVALDPNPNTSSSSSHSASPVPVNSPNTKDDNSMAPGLPDSGLPHSSLPHSSLPHSSLPHSGLLSPQPHFSAAQASTDVNTHAATVTASMKDRLSIQELVRRSKPSMIPIEMSSDRPHECKLLDPWGAVCRRSFKRPYDLQRHQESVHSAGSKSYVCKRCGGPERTFSRQDSLARHMRRMHGAQVFREEVVTNLQPADECKQKRAKIAPMTAQAV